jgi:hypothetical protein
MTTSRRTLLKNSAAAAATLSLDWRYAQAQAETVRIGVIFDHSGPFAAGGSVACAVGTQIASICATSAGASAASTRSCRSTRTRRARPTWRSTRLNA